METIKNYKPQTMSYRRFGKTEEHLSTITLGGMRYLHGWDAPREDIPNDMLKQCLNCVQLALNAGINHIETAWGYGKSERCYGMVLNDELALPRDSYYLMTKGSTDSASEMRKLVENQLKDLKTDYFDFYAYHGINNKDILKTATQPNGPLAELHKLKEEGIIKHLGFSTHAPLEIILSALQTDLFDFINLHFYYFFQRNKGAIDWAEQKDLGVFIISPNDKGGQLFYPSAKLKSLTSPLTPIQWNARFCLSHSSIHTLSFGMTEGAHFEEMKDIFPAPYPMSESDLSIKKNMDSCLYQDPYAHYEGYDLKKDPSGINIPEMLRFRRLWKCYDMETFAEYRYNMFEQKGHWFPGDFATEENLKKLDETQIPSQIPLKSMIREFHQTFYRPKTK